MPSRTSRARAVASLAIGGAEAAALWLVLAAGVVPLVLGANRWVLGPGRSSGLASLLAGLGLTAVLVIALARPLAALSRRRLCPGRPARTARWLDSAALAWLALTLTVRAAVAAVGGLLSLAAVVAVASPVLVARGDRVDLGPWRVTTVPAASMLALAGAALLAGMLWGAPRLHRGDLWLAARVLVGPAEVLERELTEATSSRARIVSAFDVERRRIERDLHDGVQPELLRVSMTLGLALAAMPGPSPARDLVAQAQEQSLGALDSLRRFVRGIHPQVLDDHGLIAALRELTSTMTVPVTIRDAVGGRVAPELEASLYYAAAELLSNVTKHSGAHRGELSLDRRGTGIVLTVADDGRGGADPAGAGLTGVRDRLAAIGADLVIESPPGGPTTAAIVVADPGPDPVHAPGGEGP